MIAGIVRVGKPSECDSKSTQYTVDFSKSPSLTLTSTVGNLRLRMNLVPSPITSIFSTSPSLLSPTSQSDDILFLFLYSTAPVEHDGVPWGTSARQKVSHIDINYFGNIKSF